LSGGLVDGPLFEVAASVHKRRFALGPFEFTAGIAPAGCAAPCTDQQQAHILHRQCSDHDPEEEESAGRSGNVLAQDREVLAQRVSGPGIVQHAGEPDEYGEE
jgi:hypothetical protein